MNIEWDYSYYQPWSDNEWLLQHEKWPDQDSNPDPSGTAPDALPLRYQVLQDITMWPDSLFRQTHAHSELDTLKCLSHDPPLE